MSHGSIEPSFQMETNTVNINAHATNASAFFIHQGQPEYVQR